MKKSNVAGTTTTKKQQLGPSPPPSMMMSSGGTTTSSGIHISGGGSGSGNTNNNYNQQQQQHHQRTIQVKIGNQAAQAMTPDQAADYLKTLSTKGWGNAIGREVKMTFGATTASSGCSTNSSSGGMMMGGTIGSSSSASVGGAATYSSVGVGISTTMTAATSSSATNSSSSSSFGSSSKKSSSSSRTSSTTKKTSSSTSSSSSSSKGAPTISSQSIFPPTASLKSGGKGGSSNSHSHVMGSSSAAGGYSSSSDTATTVSSTTTGSGGGGMPCSEKEMKALMSMFVEIMGLQMNTDRLNKVNTNNNNTSSSSGDKTSSSSTNSSGISSGESNKRSSVSSSKKSGSSSSSNVKSSSSGGGIGGSSGIVCSTVGSSGAGTNIVAGSAANVSSKNGSAASAATTTTTAEQQQQQLFSFPQNLPPPPGGWPEDLFWPPVSVDDHNNNDDEDDTEDDDYDHDDDEYGSRNGGYNQNHPRKNGFHQQNNKQQQQQQPRRVGAGSGRRGTSGGGSSSSTNGGVVNNSHGINGADNGLMTAAIAPMPALEEIPIEERQLWYHSKEYRRRLYTRSPPREVPGTFPPTNYKKNNKNSSKNNKNNRNSSNVGGGAGVMDVVTGRDGIVPFEWEALERVAVEEALEQEERTRKANHRNKRIGATARYINGGGSGCGGRANRKKTSSSATGTSSSTATSSTSSSNNSNNVIAMPSTSPSSSIAAAAAAAASTSSSSSSSATVAGVAAAAAVVSSTNAGAAAAAAAVAASAAASATTSTTSAAVVQAAKEAASRQVQAAQKKRETYIQSWRSRVVSACQSNELDTLINLLSESPLSTYTTSMDQHNKNNGDDMLDGNNGKVATTTTTTTMVQPHLEFLLPSTIPKNRKQTEKGRETREKLLEYILVMGTPSIVILTPLRNGRSVLHTACFYADVSSVEKIMRVLLRGGAGIGRSNGGDGSKKKKKKGNSSSNNNSSGGSRLELSTVMSTCQDSGWTPLHYAAVSGSMHVVEMLLRSCCGSGTVTPKPPATTSTTVGKKKNQLSQQLHDVSSLLGLATRETHTWHPESGKGLTAIQLVDAVLLQATAGGGDIGDDVIETHGMALQEVSDCFLSNPAKRSKYLALLERLSVRLKDVEANGYAPLDDKQLVAVVEEAEAAATTSTTEQRPNEAENKLVDEKQQQQQDDKSATTTMSGSGVEPTMSGSGVGPKESNKKKKKKQNAATEKSVDAPTPPKATQEPLSRAGTAGSACAPEMSKDPMVVAIVGMGFEEKQVIAGVKACGGITRATADDVVAWIFGQAPGGSDEDGSSQAADAQEEHDAKDDSDKSDGGGHTTHNTPNNPAIVVLSGVDAKRREAQKRQEEERLAAERLAAQREQQRRRNREWNKRQRYEAQAKAAKEVVADDLKPTQRNGLVPASSYLPAAVISTGLAQSHNPVTAATTPTNTTSFASTVQAKNVGQGSRKPPLGSTTMNASRASEPIESMQSNETSTVASSVDHMSLDFPNDVINDDATVSTLGSLQPRPTPTPQPSFHHQQAASAFAPPGFEAPLGGQQQDGPHQSSSSSSSSTTRGGPDFTQPVREIRAQAKPFVMSGGPPTTTMISTVSLPPEIPESSPLLDSSIHKPPTGSLVAGSTLEAKAPEFHPASVNASINASFANTGFDGAGGVDGRRDDAVTDSDVSRLLGVGDALAQNASSLFHQGMTGKVGGFTEPFASPAPSSLAVGTSDVGEGGDATLAGSLGLPGLDNDRIDGLESSIINSIFNGSNGMMIGGAPLWGDDRLSSSSTSGSSLLGNLIHTSKSMTNSNIGGNENSGDDTGMNGLEHHQPSLSMLGVGRGEYGDDNNDHDGHPDLLQSTTATWGKDQDGVAALGTAGGSIW